MADLGLDFIPDDVEAGRDFDPIPAGDYIAEIVASEVTTPKSGQGKMLKLQFKIIEGAMENRVLFDQLCYQHPNAQAQLIAQQKLKSICDAVGHRGPCSDSELLHFVPVKIRVGIRKDKTGEYADQNEIKSVKALDGSAPAPAPAMAPQRQAAPAATQATRPAPAAGGRPWGNRAASSPR